MPILPIAQLNEPTYTAGGYDPTADPAIDGGLTDSLTMANQLLAQLGEGTLSGANLTSAQQQADTLLRQATRLQQNLDDLQGRRDLAKERPQGLSYAGETDPNSLVNIDNEISRVQASYNAALGTWSRLTGAIGKANPTAPQPQVVTTTYHDDPNDPKSPAHTLQYLEFPGTNHAPMPLQATPSQQFQAALQASGQKNEMDRLAYQRGTAEETNQSRVDVANINKASSDARNAITKYDADTRLREAEIRAVTEDANRSQQEKDRETRALADAQKSADDRMKLMVDSLNAGDLANLTTYVKQGDWAQATWEHLSQYIDNANGRQSAQDIAAYRGASDAWGKQVDYQTQQALAAKEIYLSYLQHGFFAPQAFFDALGAGMEAVSRGRVLPQGIFQQIMATGGSPMPTMDQIGQQVKGMFPTLSAPPEPTFHDAQAIPPSPLETGQIGPPPARYMTPDVIQSLIPQGMGATYDQQQQQPAAAPTLSAPGQVPAITEPTPQPEEIPPTLSAGGDTEQPPASDLTPPPVPEDIAPTITAGQDQAPPPEQPPVDMGGGDTGAVPSDATLQAPTDVNYGAQVDFLMPVLQEAAQQDEQNLPRISNMLVGVMQGESPRAEWDTAFPNQPYPFTEADYQRRLDDTMSQMFGSDQGDESDYGSPDLMGAEEPAYA